MIYYDETRCLIVQVCDWTTKGVRIEETDLTETVTLWVGPNRVRRDDGNATSILLFDQKKLYIVDHQDKSYTAIDLPVDFK